MWVIGNKAKYGYFGFWLHGRLSDYGAEYGFDLSSPHGSWTKTFLVNLGRIRLLLIGAGVIIVRRVFVIFGAIGCTIYLGHLSNTVFKDSWLFPITLTAIGLVIIYLGVLWQKNEKNITRKVRSYLPVQLREFLENKAL